MNLSKIKNAIFDYNVDVFAVSIDGATDETNSRIRRGSKIDVITENLKKLHKFFIPIELFLLFVDRKSTRLNSSH